MDTVVRALHSVRDWKEFGEKLFGFFDWKHKLEIIEQQHKKTYLHGVVEEWFKGQHPSWRQIIYSLDRAKESVVADCIRRYAEPPQGEWSDNSCVTRNLLIDLCPTAGW